MRIDPDRYARHALVAGFDQDRINGLRVLVAGAGAIGNELIKNLVLLGVRRLTIVDLDHIEVHNLTRSVLFRETDVGRSKAAVAAERARDLLPEAEVTVIEGPLEMHLRPSLLARHHVVFSCLDNFEARLALDEMCQLAGVDMVNGAIDARYATVEHFPYATSRSSGCYACNLPPGAFQRIAQRYSCGWLRRVGLVERKVPTTIITSSLVASMMVSWALRLAGGDPELPTGPRRLLADTVTGTASASALARHDGCLTCSRWREHVEILPWDCRLEFAPEAQASSLSARLPTEVVFAARCTACGFDAAGTVPPGSRLRGHATGVRTCTACGAESVLIDGRDEATLAELASLPGGRGPAVPYVITDVGNTTLCLEVIHA